MLSLLYTSRARTRFVLVAALVQAATVGCLSRGPAKGQPADTHPAATEPTLEPGVVPPPPSTAELTPTVFAPAPGGSGNLVLQDGHLHWLTRTLAPRPAARVDTTPAGSGGAQGAVLDCKRTRGQLWSVSTAPGSTPSVIATMDDWPWSLGAHDHALFWLGSCADKLWTVPVGGGEPRRLGRADLAIIDYEPTADGVIVADRFGTARGLFVVEPTTGATRNIAAPGGRPWLLGTLDGTTYWGATDGDQTTVHTVGEAQTRFVIRGQPMDTVRSDGALFVLTGRSVVRIDASGPRELAPVAEYLDRGNLAVDEEAVYWANGKSGTISRVGRDGAGVVEAYVGGEPCGIAVDAATLYWIDRRGDAIVRVHRALFDDPPPIPPPGPELEPVSRILDDENPPPGLQLTATGTAVKVRGGWAIDVRLDARASGDKGFWMRTDDPVYLSGRRALPDGTGRGFMGRCTAPGRSSFELKPATTRSMTVRHGKSGEPALRAGESLELDVGLCWVLREDGKLQRAIGGTLVIDATGKGQPVVTTRPRD